MGKKGGSPKIEVTKFYMSDHLGICMGEVDELLEIYVKEKLAWEGSEAGPASLPIDKPDLFGGLKKEGGLEGYAYYMPGSQTQLLPDILAQKLGRADGNDCPGFRGFSSLFFSGVDAPVPSEAVYEGWSMEIVIAWDTLGDSYPLNTTFYLRDSSNKIRLTIEAGAASSIFNGKRAHSVGRDQIANGYRYWTRSAAGVWLPPGTYRALVDPSQNINPFSSQNDARWTIYGRNWQGSLVQLVTFETSDGFQSSSPSFAIPDFEI